MKVHILATAPDPQTGVKLARGIRISNLPKNGIQKIPESELAKHRGFFQITDDAIIYDTVDGPVRFEIEHEPGRYCLTCGEQLPDHGGNGTELEARRAQKCRDHVAEHGADAETSAAWPHGYRHSRSYTCRVVDQRGG